VSGGERGAGRTFEQIPRRLNRIEAAELERSLDRLPLPRSVTASPIESPLARSRASSSSTARSSRTPLSSLAEWIW